MRQRGPVGGALRICAGALSITVAGCNFVVGSGDYAVGPNGAGDEGGSASDDASTVPDAGLNPGADDGGNDGLPVPTADSGGGMCGPVTASGADFAQLVRSCIMTVSCNPFVSAVNISTCITEDYLDSSPSLSCLKNAKSCMDYYGCTGNEDPPLSDCPSSTPNSHCDAPNNRAVHCTGIAAGDVVDCNKYGGTCGTYVDSTMNVVSDCLVVPSCTDTDNQFHCAPGNILYTCINGKGFGRNCGNISATCATIGTDTSCYFNQPPCSTPGLSCNGDTLVDCTDARQLVNYNCKRGGMNCALDSQGGGDCVTAGCSLSSPCTESCGSDGKTLTLCVGGAAYEVDCTQESFAKCTTFTDSSATPPRTYAACE